MRRSMFLIALTLAVAAAAVWPVLALAAGPATSAAATATVPAKAGGGGPAGTIEVQIWPSDPDGAALIVSAEIPASAKLPYTVRVPLPAGLTPSWVGEVFGGDVSKDIERKFTLEDGVGGKVLVATVEQSRILQYEAALARPTSEGGRHSSVLKWVQTATAGAENFAVKMAAGTAQVTIEPTPEGTPQTNAIGETLYSLPAATLASGAARTITVSWADAAAGTGSTTSGQSPSPALIAAVAVLAGIVAILLYIAVASRMRRNGGGTEA